MKTNYKIRLHSTPATFAGWNKNKLITFKGDDRQGVFWSC